MFGYEKSPVSLATGGLESGNTTEAVLSASPVCIFILTENYIYARSVEEKMEFIYGFF